MRTIHQAFRRRTAQYPTELRDFGDVGLAIKKTVFGVQPQRQPRRRNFSAGLSDLIWILVLDQGVKIRQEQIRLNISLLRCSDRRADGAYIVPQMRRSRCGNPRQYSRRCHGVISL